jgi:5-methylcytosine-specific restriction endonuclease McrA
MEKRKKIESIQHRVPVISTKVGSSVAVDRIVGREHGRIRLRILVRDGAACVKCGCGMNLEVDHIVPLALGGSNSSLNLQTLCRSCHSLKSDEEAKRRI